MNNWDALAAVGLAVFALQRRNDAGPQRMFAGRSLRAANDGVGHFRTIESEGPANLYPIDRNAGILANDHVLFASQRDGLEIMGKYPLRYFLGFRLRRALDGSDDIGGNFLERLDVEIAASGFDQVVELFLN